MDQLDATQTMELEELLETLAAQLSRTRELSRAARRRELREALHDTACSLELAHADLRDVLTINKER